jgi:hypothetical protein
MLGALPALSGCIAAVVPVAVAGLAAKKKLIDKKHRVEVVEIATPPTPEPSPAAPALAKAPEPLPAVAPAPERVPVFAGEGSAKASLAPAGLGNPPAPRLYTVTDALPPPAPVVTTTVTYPSSAPQIKVSEAAIVTPRAEPKKMATATTTAALPGSAEKSANGYAGLAAYTIRHANSPEANSSLDVIDPTNPLDKPRRAQCGALAPAVMIDLDPGLSTFDPDALKPAPDLGDALAALRAAGITILWTSALPIEQSETVHFTLARAGLDPNRTDHLLLLKGGGDRKQARRNLAAHNWCVIAMAGDRRGDFDEAFDYLRDPDTKIPADALFGDGWFIVPPPLP